MADEPTPPIDSGPPAPSGARLQRGDETIPLELVYQGLTEEGLHLWGTTLSAYDPKTDVVLIDILPPKTTVSIALAE